MDLTIFCENCTRNIKVIITCIEYNTPEGYCVINYKCPLCGHKGKYVMNL